MNIPRRRLLTLVIGAVVWSVWLGAGWRIAAHRLEEKKRREREKRIG